jgi:glutaconate CoA-transferase, subunit A
MADKRTTVAEIVSEIRPGMTVGIGGWGSRRKPMAVVRALCRSGITGLRVVAYGGPDVGLLCATGVATAATCPFVTLDVIPIDPHWRVARQGGKAELFELDEGMFFLGLQAASWRLPFLPSRAGLGSDVLTANPDIKTVRSPYDSGPFAEGPDAGAELVAVPAIHLDVAIIHANRADTAGNAQFLGPDRFFDELFLGAARRRFVTAERVVENGALEAEGPLSAVTVHRMLTDGVAETPRGAHFTACPPDYGRDDAFLRTYTAAATDDDAFAAFRARYLDVEEPEYQAAVAAGAETGS